MNFKKTILFFIKKRKPGATRDLDIIMRAKINGKSIEFATGCSTDAQFWNAPGQCVFDNTPNADSINATISNYKSIMSECFARYELIEKRIPELGEIRNLFNDMIGKSTPLKEMLSDPATNLFKAFDLFVDTIGKQNEWTPGTFEKFHALRAHLKSFDPHLSFMTVDDAKMQQYVEYLQKLDFKNTTISKNISFCRWFFRWAYNAGYYPGRIHETFKPKLKGTSVDSKEIIYLTMDELQQLETYQFSESQKALERVRDVFVFQCYTGLRYSDVAKLRRSDIKGTFIHVVTKKTVDGLNIELNRHSIAIIDKYKESNFPGGLVLPIISNEKMNAHLKTVGQTVGLNEPTRIVYFKGNVRHEEVYPKWSLLTTHVGRRTFVVMALQLGIPAEVIIRWTGHSNYDAMKPYAKIVDEVKRNAMSKFDNI